MQKYKIELTEEQMSLIAQCLEDCSRFASGQWQMEKTITEMLKDLDIYEQTMREELADMYLRFAKKALLPEMSDSSSKGYNGTEFIGNTYQIYRTILYQLAIDNNHNNVYSYPALPSGTMGTIKIEKI